MLTVTMDPMPIIAPKGGGGAQGSVMQPRNPQRQAPTSRNLNRRGFLGAERLFLATLEFLYDDREIHLKMSEQLNVSLKGAKPPEEAIRTLDRELQENVDLGETT